MHFLPRVLLAVLLAALLAAGCASGASPTKEAPAAPSAPSTPTAIPMTSPTTPMPIQEVAQMTQWPGSTSPNIDPAASLASELERPSLPPGWAQHQGANGDYTIGVPPGWSVDAESCNRDPAKLDCTLLGPSDDRAEILSQGFLELADFPVESVEDHAEATRLLWEQQGIPAETTREAITLPGGEAIRVTARLSDESGTLLVAHYIFAAGDRRVIELQFLGMGERFPATWEPMAATFFAGGVPDR